jgi:hypothetical protein
MKSDCVNGLFRLSSCKALLMIFYLRLVKVLFLFLSLLVNFKFLIVISCYYPWKRSVPKRITLTGFLIHGAQYLKIALSKGSTSLDT